MGWGWEGGSINSPVFKVSVLEEIPFPIVKGGNAFSFLL